MTSHAFAANTHYFHAKNSGLGNSLQNEHQRFDHLYKQYASLLFGLISRNVPDMDSRDRLMTIIFQKIWLNWQHYNPEQLRLFTWMYQIAISELSISGAVVMPEMVPVEDAYL